MPPPGDPCRSVEKEDKKRLRVEQAEGREEEKKAVLNLLKVRIFSYIYIYILTSTQY